MHNLMTDELCNALDELAESLLRRGGVIEPPVDAIALARRLAISVVFHRRTSTRARLKRLAGGTTIVLQPDRREERMHWAVAHELAEHEAHRVFARLGVRADEATPAVREHVANRLAARILLPSAWFIADARACDADLPQLKRRYRTASHESIAWRTLDLPGTAIVTVFDQGMRTARRSNHPGRVPPLQPAERACWEEVHETGQPARLEDPPLCVTGWAVHEPGWKREILRTEIEADIITDQ